MKMANAAAYVFSIASGEPSPGVGDLILWAQVTTEADPDFVGTVPIDTPYGTSQAQMRLALQAAILQYLSDNGFPVSGPDTLFLLGI